MPTIEVRKRKGESLAALVYRFTKRVKQSGVLKEYKKRRFRGRLPNKRKVRLSARHRHEKTLEVEKARKFGAV